MSTRRREGQHHHLRLPQREHYRVRTRVVEVERAGLDKGEEVPAALVEDRRRVDEPEVSDDVPKTKKWSGLGGVRPCRGAGQCIKGVPWVGGARGNIARGVDIGGGEEWFDELPLGRKERGPVKSDLIALVRFGDHPVVAVVEEHCDQKANQKNVVRKC